MDDVERYLICSKCEGETAVHGHFDGTLSEAFEHAKNIAAHISDDGYDFVITVANATKRETEKC
jgi:predicted ABC-class ATPase